MGYNHNDQVVTWRNKGEVILKKIICVGAVCFMAGLSACTNTAGDISDERKENVSVESLDENMENEPEESGTSADGTNGTDAEGSKMPKVLIDLNGYCPDDKKAVYFLGSEDAEDFRIIDGDTREEVYKGAMTVVPDEKIDGKVLLKGDFTPLNEEGNYYIEAPHIGRSYSFEIKDGHFGEIYDTLKTAVREGASDPEVGFLYRTQALFWLLYDYEYYEKEDVLLREMPDFLQQAKSLGDELLEEKPEEMDQGEMAFYCAAMARLYEEIKEYDLREANKFLWEAESVYKLLERRRYEEDFDDVWLFFDGAVLYKATGAVRYHNVIKNYMNQQNGRDFFAEDVKEEQLLADEAYVHGAVAYLSTVSNVDINISSALMKELTDKAESMEEEQEGNAFLCVSRDRRNRLLSDRLFVIAIVEHVVVSKEYVQTMEDGIHYINGCNMTGRSFLSEQGVADKMTDEKGSDAAIGGAYLFILGEIMESEAAK